MENDHSEKIGPACPACLAPATKFFCRKNNCDLYRCPSCRLVFVSPLPTETASIYEGDYFSGAEKGFGYVSYDEDKKTMAGIFNGYLQKLEQLNGNRPGHLLDVGAATGYFLGLVKQRGWTGAGLEISDYAAAKGRAKGLDVKTGILGPDLFPAGFFDVVSMWDVIEHVREPKKDLQTVASLLHPCGVLVINTPNGASLTARILGPRWHLLVPPEHLHYFNPRALSLLLQQSGFQVLSVHYPGKVFTLEYIFHTLARWQGLSLWQSILSWLKRHPSVGQWGLPINLRDNMLIYARKN